MLTTRRRHIGLQDKLLMVLSGIADEWIITGLTLRESISPNLYYR